MPTTHRARALAPSSRTAAPLLGKDGFAVDRGDLPRGVGDALHPQADRVPRGAAGAASSPTAWSAWSSVRAVAGGAAGAPQHRRAARSCVPGADMRIVAIYRRPTNGPDRFIVCDGATRIEPGDEVFVLSAARAHAPRARRRCAATTSRSRVERVMIAGGGRVGLRLARAAARTQLPAQDDRARRRALRVPGHRSCRPTCWCCTATAPTRTCWTTRTSTSIDLFLALTSDDEDNIMACLLAKRLGARRVLALINRRSLCRPDAGHADRHRAVAGADRDRRAAGLRAARRRRRRCTACAAARPRRWRPWRAATARPRAWSAAASTELELPEGAQVGAIVRGCRSRGRDAGSDAPPRSSSPHHDTVIESNDHVVIFVPRKRMVRDVEKLFQVSATFF